MHKRIPTVLFIGKRNCSRSIIAESILNEDFGDKFLGFSAGHAPKQCIHPITLNLLRSFGYDTRYLRSKSWNEFVAPDALCFDFAFTLCETILDVKYPVLNGRPIKARWEIPDPAEVQSSETEQYAAFKIAYKTIRERIAQFARLPFTASDRASLTQKAKIIGIQPVTVNLMQNVLSL